MTQCEELLAAFRRGEELTVAEAMGRYDIFALSQRCTDLRKAGYPVTSEMIVVASGKRVARYRLADEEMVA
jgi:hypothetical protein